MILKMKAEIIIDLTEEEFDMFTESGEATMLLKHIKSGLLEIVDENDKDVFEVGIVDIKDRLKKSLKDEA